MKKNALFSFRASQFLNVTICALLFVLLSLPVFATTDIVGMELKYTHISGNTYQIRCLVYNNCNSSIVSLTSGTPEICIFNDSTYVATIHLAWQPGTQIEYYCPFGVDSTVCTNTAYPYPGIKTYEYSGTYTLPSTSHLCMS